MLTRPLVIAWKELLQLQRDRMTLAMMAVLPIVQLLLFGYAINTDVRHIPTLIYDQDHSAQSRELGQSLTAAISVHREIIIWHDTGPGDTLRWHDENEH